MFDLGLRLPSDSYVSLISESPSSVAISQASPVPMRLTINAGGSGFSGLLLHKILSLLSDAILVRVWKKAVDLPSPPAPKRRVSFGSLDSIPSKMVETKSSTIDLSGIEPDKTSSH